MMVPKPATTLSPTIRIRGSNMKTPYYGMFTDEGNAAVHNIVTTAHLLDISWIVVLQMLEKLSKVKGFEEAVDTAVREEVSFVLYEEMHNAS